MKRIKNTHITVTILAILVLFLCLFSSCSDEGISWRNGIFSTVSFSITSNGNEVSATARNDFTLGFATTKLTIYIYSSETNTTDISDMIEEKSGTVDDLNIFRSFVVKCLAPTDGKYYCALMRYRNNNGGTESVQTPTIFVKP